MSSGLLTPVSWGVHCKDWGAYLTFKRKCCTKDGCQSNQPSCSFHNQKNADKDYCNWQYKPEYNKTGKFWDLLTTSFSQIIEILLYHDVTRIRSRSYYWICRQKWTLLNILKAFWLCTTCVVQVAGLSKSLVCCRYIF